MARLGAGGVTPDVLSHVRRACRLYDALAKLLALYRAEPALRARFEASGDPEERRWMLELALRELEELRSL